MCIDRDNVNKTIMDENKLACYDQKHIAEYIIIQSIQTIITAVAKVVNKLDGVMIQAIHRPIKSGQSIQST